MGRRAALLEIDPEHPEPRRVQQAVDKLTAGQVVLYPTDTLYGIGGDLLRRDAADKIVQLRLRDPKKPLSIVCSSLSEASRYAIIDDDCHRVMRRVLPGPYTFILKATREIPRTGDKVRRVVGVRIPGHPVAAALVKALGHPILSASAVPPEDGPPDVSDPVQLAERYGSDTVGLVLDAGILRGAPSTVIDWSEGEPVLVRRGAGEVAFLEG
jgi:tRNA threonylcarbamoyl adenosine modification protein (Sua5/YciO/YrdC/YwlC family)